MSIRAAAAAGHRPEDGRGPPHPRHGPAASRSASRILRALEFQVEEVGTDALRATAPPHRLDIQEGPADLIEDLVRLHGYDRLPATLLADQLPPQQTNEPLVFEERRARPAGRCGLQEVITYALTTPEREKPLGLADVRIRSLCKTRSAASAW